MSIKDDYTIEWQQYQDGIDFNLRINLYENVNKNERFYAGDQWAGVVSNGLPTPVFNFFKRIINYFIAAIMSQNTAIQFVPIGIPDDPETPEEIAIKEAAETITQYAETLQERTKMNQMLRQWLLDAALSGDAAAYCYWDPDIKTGGKLPGDINMEAPDSVNVMFGNPNDRRVETQPYIIIAFRELVSKLKEEAKANGMDEFQVNLISSDDETYYQAGDRSQIELNDKGDSGKCTALLKLWKEDGKVYARKCVRQTVIRDKWDTKLTRYPVAWMNWDVRKNSYHGQAVGTGLVPNQIFINKMFAMAMMSLMHTAFPKAIYNSDLITNWNNQIGTAIGISGANGDIGSAAKYLNPGQMSEQVFKLIDLAIQYTKDTLGATDAALGDVNPDNTSAIIAVQQSSAIPLESIKQNMYQLVEDIGYIWLDFMANYYGKRTIDVEVMGKRIVKEFDFAMLKKMQFRIKIDVGPSSYWSEISAMKTLDNLLQSDRITFLQYLDRVPNGIIPSKNELLEDIKAQDQKQQFIYEQMARFMEALPPEIQQMYQSLKPEDMEQQLMDLMMMPPEEQQAQLAQMMGQIQPVAPQGTAVV